MKTTTRPLGLALAASVLVSGSVLAAPLHADAAGSGYRSVLKLYDADLKLCKKKNDAGTRFRVLGFLDNTDGERGSDEIFGEVVVQKRGKNTSERFKTPMIAPGERSKVYSVSVPARKAFGLVVTAAAPNAGSGGEIGLGSVNRC